MADPHECAITEIVVEIPELYDGGLFYECGVCGRRRHRWPVDHPRHALAEPYVSSTEAT